jgi:GT2 family glycosyltransferase
MTIPRIGSAQSPGEQAVLATSHFKPASHCDLAQDGRLTGFVFDPDRLERRFTIEVLLDGLVVATSHANRFVPELFERQASHGDYGFVVDLTAQLLAAARTLQVRIANLGTPIGTTIELTQMASAESSTRAAAALQWLGGLRFAGWVDGSAEQHLETVIDGEAVSRVRAAHWIYVDDDGSMQAGRNARGFDFHLPQRFADGCVHKLTLRRQDGEPLPVMGTFVAFPDGLAGTLAALGDHGSERLRGRLYDQLIPSSLPLADYVQWRERFPSPAPASTELETAVIVAGSSGAEQTLATLENQTHPAWTAAVIDGAALMVEPNLVAEFLAEAAPNADILVVLMAGVHLDPDALARIASAFDDHPDAHALYGDLDFLASDGQLWPVAFPAFDYERMLEQGYCAHLFAMRREIAVEALQSAPNNLYRFFNAMLDWCGPQQRNILHLPGALACLPKFNVKDASAQLESATLQHLQARDVEAMVAVGRSEFFPAVKVLRTSPYLAKATVVIPTRDRLPLLRACVESIRPAVERCSADILVVDNDSTDPQTLEYLDGLSRRGTRILRVEGPFNFARINNQAAAAIETDALCLLNNDVEANSDDWLEEMLSRLMEPDVGAVGALLTYPGGVIQHGGVVLGVNFGAAHAFTDRLFDDPGYLDLLRVAHECSAVTAACLVTRRADYLDTGGMDEARFGVAFNDVDYCLKLRENGKRIVFTPHARLIHAESASRGRDARPDKRDRFERELAMLRARWGESLLEDKTYNPQLSRDGVPYRALAWPPGPLRPRANAPQRARELPPGF